MLDGFSTRAAWALCTLAYSAGPGTEPILFEGRTGGNIVPARGPPNVGWEWDPVFEAEDTGFVGKTRCACGKRVGGWANARGCPDVFTHILYYSEYMGVNMMHGRKH